MNYWKLVGVLGVTLMIAFTAGCDAQTENDAPAVPSPVSGPAEVLPMPDGFSNVATRCDGHGNRIYTIYRTWATGAYPVYGAVAVGPDTDGACKKEIGMLP
jgi:hypothetical protein